MEPIEPKTSDKKDYRKTGKYILISCVIFSFSIIIGVMGYWVEHNSDVGQWPQSSPNVNKEISKIEISEDKKAVLNAENKEAIFTIDDAKKYFMNSGFGYDPETRRHDAKYTGDCFSSISLSNTQQQKVGLNFSRLRQQIIFSTGCLDGDTSQPWIGIYELPALVIPFDDCIRGPLCMGPGMNKPNEYCVEQNCKIPAKFILFVAGGGNNFVWSADDKTISYETDPGLSGTKETCTIDSMTGDVLERKIETKIDTAGWLTYDSTANAELYYERYKIKYPRELFYKTERAIGTHKIATFFKDKFNKMRFDIQVSPEMNNELVYDPQYYSISKVKINGNDFQEVKDIKTGALSYIYKTGYSDKNHNGDFYIIFNVFDPGVNETLIASLSTLKFLGNIEKKEAIIGADEGSWKQVFRSEKYGFQLKAQNGFDIINKLDENMSLTFVDGFSNIYFGMALLSSVSSAEEWLDRDLTINPEAPKKIEREYYRIGDSDAFGILVNQKDSSGELKNHVFYASRGKYLYSISAPIVNTNEFAYARMISNFRFLEPNAKLIGLKSKWGFENVFEFNAESGKLERTLNEKDFAEKGYEWRNVKWYEIKVPGIVPDEIKSYFPVLEINPQGSMNTGDWKTYRNKDKALELSYPKEWEMESYSASNIIYFNVNKEKENSAYPRVTIIIDRNPVPTETLSIVGDVSIVKFNGIEALAMTMYGEKGETDPYSYISSGNTYFIEFHSGAHDYYIEYHFNGGSYNLQEFNTFLSSMRIN